MTPALSVAQIAALRHAAYRSGDDDGYGFLYGRMCGSGDGLGRPTGPSGWRASCSCGSVLMQPMDGRSVLGLLRRGLIRRGSDYEFSGETWARFVATEKGRKTLEAMKP